MQEIQDYAELTKLWEMGSWKKDFEEARSNICSAVYGHFNDLSGRDQKVELSPTVRKSLRRVEDIRDRLFL